MIRNLIQVSLSIILVAAALSCSVPNLETPACSEARTRLREFYSFHFGNGLQFSQEALNQRKKFLTPEFASRLALLPDGADPFTTGSTDLPKAFRVGECRAETSDRISFQILLFWRDENRTEQREINADMVRRGDQWFVDDVKNTGNDKK